MTLALQHDPVAVVEAAIDAFRREAWEEVPPLCHPASLGAFKAQQLRQYAPRDAPPRLSVEALLHLIPDMPRPVAEYNIDQRDRMLQDMQDPARDFDGITTVDEVRASSPAALFTAWLRAHAPSREVARAAREQGHSEEPIAQAMAAAGDQFRFVALGAVPDGLDVAHVLYRDAPRRGDADASVDAWRAQQTDDERELASLVGDAYFPRLVMCLRLPGGGWGLNADRHLFGLGSFGVGSGFMASDEDEPESPG